VTSDAGGTKRLGVVTGAAGVLGRAVVAELAGRGDRIVAVGRSADDVRDLAETHGASVEVEGADLANADEVEALWRRLDDRGEHVAFLANLVGGFRGGKLVDTSPEDYRHLLSLNLDTAWWSCREAARRMREAGGGAIVNVSARPGLEGGAGSAAYAIAKAGVLRLTQVLALELKDAGVRVNAVVPSLIDTPDNRKDLPAERMAKAVAPEAIARVVAFLCGDEAGPTTGAAVPVYGRS
jgi:NAD(P)-dependent dehydrogenase (short-subunit alcohol dehydrogenase family)